MPPVFTGIIESIGTVTTATGDEVGRRLGIESSLVASDLPIGASVSVDGTCLTVVEVAGDVFVVELVTETLNRTSLGAVAVGSRVNLERAMSVSGRFDGHIVQGHVDGVGVVVAVAGEGDGLRMTIEAPRSVSGYLVEKGSVTVQGVSLTVAGLVGSRFEVALIPHTLEVTTLGDLAVGDEVNLEADILAKYIEALIRKRDA
jgi:riboflavin synthase